MAKTTWIVKSSGSWIPTAAPSEDGWLIELTNDRSFPASLFVQWLVFNAPKGTSKDSLNPDLILLSDNTANPRESILFKLSATHEEIRLLKGNRLRIHYGTGYGERSSSLDVELP